MKKMAVPSLGEFRLKCSYCEREHLFVTGGNLLQLGDYPDGDVCPFCRRVDTSFVVEVPTVLDYDTTT